MNNTTETRHVEMLASDDLCVAHYQSGRLRANRIVQATSLYWNVYRFQPDHKIGPSPEALRHRMTWLAGYVDELNTQSMHEPGRYVIMDPETGEVVRDRGPIYSLVDGKRRYIDSPGVLEGERVWVRPEDREPTDGELSRALAFCERMAVKLKQMLADIDHENAQGEHQRAPMA